MNVRFIRCTSDLLESIPIIDGQLLITSDTAYLYADINTQRVQIVCNNSGEGGGDTPVDPSEPSNIIALTVPSYAAELKVINSDASGTIDLANASTIIDTINGKTSNLYLPNDGAISSYEGENIYINLDNISSPEKVFYYTFANSSGDYGDYKTLIYPSYTTRPSNTVTTDVIKVMWLDSAQNIDTLDTISVENSVVDYISFKKPSTSTHLRIVRVTNSVTRVILDTATNTISGSLLCPLYTGTSVIWESYSHGQPLSVYNNQYLVFYINNSIISDGDTGGGGGGGNDDNDEYEDYASTWKPDNPEDPYPDLDINDYVVICRHVLEGEKKNVIQRQYVIVRYGYVSSRLPAGNKHNVWYPLYTERIYQEPPDYPVKQWEYCFINTNLAYKNNLEGLETWAKEYLEPRDYQRAQI